MTTDTTNTTRDRSLPSDDFTRQIIGLLFQVHNALGPGYQEKYYQRAFEKQLQESGIEFRRELHCPITFKNQSIGRYYLDFLLQEQLVVELKVSDQVHRHYFKQVLGYLDYTGVKLGLIACFGPEKVLIKRVIR